MTNYFKILRWMGGEGGDTLLFAALISNPQIDSNIDVEQVKFTNSRTVLPRKLLNFKNINYLTRQSHLIKIEELNEELKVLKQQGKNWLLKSHFFGDYNNAINLLATDLSLDFFLAARYTKIPLCDLVNNKMKEKMLAANKTMFVEYEKKLILKNLETIKRNENDITIDEILNEDYNSIESKLELKFNSDSRDYIHKWVEKQKQTFPKELAAFS